MMKLPGPTIDGKPIAFIKRGAPEPALSNASFALMSDATPTNGNMTADGFTWAQGAPMLVDQYGKYISLVQWSNSGTNTNSFVVSNDGGATWSYPTHTSMANSSGELFITRGSAAYDTINDLVHVLWRAVDPNDGMIYRRYSITRDGSDNIIGFTRVSGINLQLDYQTAGTMDYQHPVLIFSEYTDTEVGIDGALLAIWGARNSASGTGTRSEIRASMRVLSNTTADNTASNWIAPVSASTSAIGQSPQVAYSAIVAKAAASSLCHPSAARRSNGDVVIVYTDGDNTEEIQTVTMEWNWGTYNWSTGVTSPIKVTDIVRSGTDTGYSLKRELITAPHFDAMGNTYVGFCTWNGTDTWSYVQVTPAGAVTVVDVYTSDVGDNGASDFVTGDIMFDSLTGRLVVAYTDLPAKHIYAAVYNGVTQTKAPVSIFSDRPFDIPTLYPAKIDGNVLVLGRDFNDASTDNPPTYTPPYDGYFGTVQFR